MQPSPGPGGEDCVACSSQEAEYIALCATAQETVSLRRILASLDVEQTTATHVYEDNQPCIQLANNPMTRTLSKHVNTKFHYTREQVEMGEIVLQYVHTASNLADCMTKPLPAPRLTEHRDIILGPQSW